MARLKLRDDDLCWRCNTDIGTMVHMLYECDKVKELWEKIVHFVNNIFSLTFYERVIFTVSGRLDLYMKIWGSFLALIEKMV
uniref:Reverse transcriptase zinc-binding domain-containing protein n=1 Tax=Sinocyclocheilus rhinocerous TaxID=307959 RepID=A0A673HV93_9TELE